jgi:hypothetical protein
MSQLIGRTNQSAYILDAGINTSLINGQAGLNTGYKQAYTVDGVKQGGNHGLVGAHMAAANLIQQMLESMCIISEIWPLHHRCTALDGVHTPEKLIDQSTIPGPGIEFQCSFFHLLQKLD